MKTVMKTDEVYDYFLNRLPATSSRRNLTSDGMTLKSYEMVIARFSPLVSGLVELLDFPNASPTTSKHASGILHAVSKAGYSYVSIPSEVSMLSYSSGFNVPKNNKYYNFPPQGMSICNNWTHIGKGNLSQLLASYRNPHRLMPKFVEFRGNEYRETYIYSEDMMKRYVEPTITVPCERCNGGEMAYCWKCHEGKVQVLSEENSLVGICFYD